MKFVRHKVAELSEWWSRHVAASRAAGRARCPVLTSRAQSGQKRRCVRFGFAGWNVDRNADRGEVVQPRTRAWDWQVLAASWRETRERVRERELTYIRVSGTLQPPTTINFWILNKYANNLRRPRRWYLGGSENPSNCPTISVDWFSLRGGRFGGWFGNCKYNPLWSRTLLSTYR